jgi:hypothetical protein
VIEVRAGPVSPRLAWLRGKFVQNFISLPRIPATHLGPSQGISSGITTVTSGFWRGESRFCWRIPDSLLGVRPSATLRVCTRLQADWAAWLAALSGRRCWLGSAVSPMLQLCIRQADGRVAAVVMLRNRQLCCGTLGIQSQTNTSGVTQSRDAGSNTMHDRPLNWRQVNLPTLQEALSSGRTYFVPSELRSEWMQNLETVSGAWIYYQGVNRPPPLGVLRLRVPMPASMSNVLIRRTPVYWNTTAISMWRCRMAVCFSFVRTRISIMAIITGNGRTGLTNTVRTPPTSDA